MKSEDTFHFNNETIQLLLLEMAQQRTTKSLFNLIVKELSKFKNIALARIWLVEHGDICSSCLMKKECSSQGKCLHLAASAGCSSLDTSLSWSRLDGAHRRFPFGARKVGHIAATGKPVVVRSIKDDSTWIGHPDWAKREGINGFAGQPMRFKKETLGVLAIFTKSELSCHVLDILRIIADHAASALATTRAFEKINDLTRKLENENDYLRKEILHVTSYGGFIGQSAALQKILQQIDLVASTNANVLILGESGTGKELVVREVHHRSKRKDKPIIKVNCAAISKELFASEFFGHAKGSFTGALTSREGKFGAAHNGTLFLDEIGEIPLDQQGQLLRVLQEREYQRVGEEKTRKVNVRIVAATNRNLREEVNKGRFREDLYFRINVFPISVPPLRERKEDIGLLANHFLARFLTGMNRSSFQFEPEQIKQLEDYHWPGNIRELQNTVERYAITSNSGIFILDIPNSINYPETSDQDISQKNSRQILTESELIQLQIKNTESALNQCGWKIYGRDGAANLLALKPTTLATRIKKMDLHRHQ
jgi:formate hydrogenlyase transcriptional activator